MHSHLFLVLPWNFFPSWKARVHFQIGRHDLGMWQPSRQAQIGKSVWEDRGRTSCGFLELTVIELGLLPKSCWLKVRKHSMWLRLFKCTHSNCSHFTFSDPWTTAGSTYFPSNLPFLFEHCIFCPVGPAPALAQSGIHPKALALAISDWQLSVGKVILWLLWAAQHSPEMISVL